MISLMLMLSLIANKPEIPRQANIPSGEIIKADHLIIEIDGAPK